MSIDSSLCTLEQLTNREDAAWCFNVPIYQRLYVWGDDQIKTLLTDMANAFDRRDTQFFLGGTLLVEKTTAEDRDQGMRRFDLIDGQQRFTTLWMLSTVPVWREVMGDFSRVVLKNGTIPRLQFSIREEVNDFLASMMPGGKAVNSEAIDTRSMREAQQLMASFAQTYKRADGGPVDDEYLKALAGFVYRTVSLVLTQVPEGMDLNKLFEVINNRGIQLQHHEILKARLLHDIPAENRSRYAALWNACADMSGFVERNLCLETQLDAHRLGDLYSKGQLLHAGAVHGLLGRKADATQTDDDDRLTLEDIVGGSIGDTGPARTTITEDDGEAPWARSIIGFPLFLLHVLRIWLKEQGPQDLPRVLDRQLLALFEAYLLVPAEPAQRAARAQGFIDLLWRMRVLWDEYVIKWVDQGDEEIHQVCHTSISASEDKRYINRSRDNTLHQGLSLLQSMLYHTQEITTHYWLTPFLYFIHKHAHTVRGGGGEIERYYGFLCHLDNQLLGEVTDSSLVARSRRFMDTPWRNASVLQFESALAENDGVRFAHYWFYKLDFVLWYEQQADREFWGNFRFTAKNSVEHISPQNPQATDTNTVSKEWLDRFGNLALVSRSINSEYGNLPFNEKRQRFLNKREYEKRPDSLKMDLIYSNDKWGEAVADAHHSAMLSALRRHYQRAFNID
ncbi:DUF262 domain-containing protein [Aquipseudomonas alcaligenes]|uniref:DUF262 domain-containing protein n=1 Tax=Aquipseudomonas alcaligenes (strain ATCC 14909 / DSM 50342 / CCUG 1425 / JCM 20561 / NBRC 14159 / NCIMB 9945 / NCTC 10367 / 1577) TaxID=1215092 RepID=U2ZPR3_AQUA1|nr:DUF262 domain-containing protein [Pseudomonas alcaligenes]GAD63435.1 hypothetical protein PA6_024_00060 [Pseudomonas alcaligenes NBRC 14159]SUD16775.1 Uncharacterized conserved protein [Pseudomonas alcaligenes]